jgi:hypothetical protein
MHYRLATALIAALALAFGSCSQTETKDEADPPAPAKAPVQAAESVAQQNEVASFSVPELDGKLAAELAQALAGVNGVVKASPKIGDQLLEVEFTPGTTTPAAILTALKGVSAAVAHKGVHAADPSSEPQHGCGGCPYRNECGGE